MSTRTATATDDWNACHALLEEALDLVEERSPRWAEVLLDLIPFAQAAPCASRVWGAGVGFAKEMHRELDFALRCDAGARGDRLARISAALACKAKHQDTLIAMVDELAAVTRALAASHHGHLDPDTADPIVSLRDGLMLFDIMLVKEELRTLLRPDKYSFQQIPTNDNPVLIRFGELLAGPDFACWQLKGPPSICGAVAQGHPERYTWFLEDVA